MNLLAIVDLDGTLCDISARAAMFGPEPDRNNRFVYRRWADSMTAGLLHLPANSAVLETVRCLYRGGAHITYLTSREESHRDVSQQWLNKFAAPFGHLLMRPYEDWRSTAEVKGGIIRGLLERHNGPVVALDDDANGELSPVYAELGISHLRVMDNLHSWDSGDNGPEAA